MSRKEYSTAIIEKDVHRLVKIHCAKTRKSLIEFYTKAAVQALPLEVVKTTKKKSK